MAEMRSFTIVIAMFTRYWEKYKDFRAVERTAKEYPYAKIDMVIKMLESLRILDMHENGVKYNLEQLAEVVEYMVDHEHKL